MEKVKYFIKDKKEPLYVKYGTGGSIFPIPTYTYYKKEALSFDSEEEAREEMERIKRLSPWQDLEIIEAKEEE